MISNERRPTARLCEWACETMLKDIPASVRKETVTLIYDQVGGMIASADLPSCRPVVSLIRRLDARGECSIVGHSLRTSVTYAALANATIGDGAEVDSTGQHETGHFAATIVPTALTVAQYARVSGADLCRSIAVGSEVTARLQSLLNRYGTRKQFGVTVGGTLGASVATCLLLSMGPDEMEHALGLAAFGACGLSSFHAEELHQAKSINHGRAAEAGVQSALLAREGCHSPREILTIENGFFDAFLGLPNVGHEVVIGLGDDYLMRQIAYKRYPVGGPNQAPLHALLQLINTHKLAAEDIKEIEVSVSRNAFEGIVTNQHPSIHLETILLLAAVYGEVTFDHIHNVEYLTAPRFEASKKSIRVLIIPKAGSRPKSERLQTHVEVRTADGRLIAENLRYPLMDEGEIQQKFRRLVGRKLESNHMAALEKKLLAVEEERDVVSLMMDLELPRE